MEEMEERELTVKQQILGLLEAATPDGSFTIHEVVAKVHRDLQKKDPDLLAEAKDEMFESWLQDYYGNVLRKRRSVMRMDRSLEFNRDRTLGIMSGSASIFDAKFCVSQENSWKRLGDMVADDHYYVAAQYEKTGRKHLMLASFHRVLGRRVQGKKTEEVLSAEEIERVYYNELQSIRDEKALTAEGGK